MSNTTPLLPIESPEKLLPMGGNIAQPMLDMQPFQMTENLLETHADKLLTIREMMSMGGAELAAHIGEEFTPTSDKGDLMTRIRREQGYNLALAALPSVLPLAEKAVIIESPVMSSAGAATIVEKAVEKPVAETVISDVQKAEKTVSKEPDLSEPGELDGLELKWAEDIAKAAPKPPKTPKEPLLKPLVTELKSQTVMGIKLATANTRKAVGSAFEKVKSSRKLRSIGKYASAAAVVAVLIPHTEEALESLSRTDKVVSAEPAAEAVPTTTIPEAAAVSTVPTPETTAPATTAPNEIVEETETPVTAPATTSTTSTTSSTTTTTVAPETIPPRTPTLLETVANGELRLEDIPGQKVGVLSIDGIGLDDIQISVTNAVELAAARAAIESGTVSGTAEEVRSQANPLYRIETDATPQTAQDLEGDSDHVGRWEAPIKGSQRLINEFDSPAQLVPQADIHPYSVLPGEAGVTYIQGHRTTYSAPFMNLDALLPGQTANFSDGFNTYSYSFVGFEQVSPNIHIDEILARGIDGKNIIIISTCDQGDNVRLLAIFVQLS